MTHPRLESAKVVLDSISPNGDRLTTIELTMWRPMLAEFNTHRSHSRNSASSRAIPVEKQIAKVENTPAFPIFWASEQPGMQGGGELTEGDLRDAKDLYASCWWSTVEKINIYLREHPDKSTRLHKSLINRLMEPFMWHTIIATATEAGWENFFKLRSTHFSKLAQPEIAAVADMAYVAYSASTPQLLEYGEWHTPYITADDDFSSFEDPTEARKQVSVARCARVSYLTHDGVRDLEEDVAMYGRLTSANPPHDSPMEHVATPASGPSLGNFDGWDQLRHYKKEPFKVKTDESPVKANPREQLLTEANKLVNGDRNNQYGDPNQDFKRIASFWTTYLEGIRAARPEGAPLVAHDVAAMMTLMKVSRLCWGYEKYDSWVDGAGYLACGWDTVVNGS